MQEEAEGRGRGRGERGQREVDEELPGGLCGVVLICFGVRFVVSAFLLGREKGQVESEEPLREVSLSLPLSKPEKAPTFPL